MRVDQHPRSSGSTGLGRGRLAPESQSSLQPSHPRRHQTQTRLRVRPEHAAPYRQEPTDGRRARDEEEGGGCLLSVDLPLGLQLSRRLADSQTRRHQLCLPLTSLVPSALFSRSRHRVHIISPHLTLPHTSRSSRLAARLAGSPPPSRGPRPSPRIHRNSPRS